MRSALRAEHRSWWTIRDDKTVKPKPKTIDRDRLELDLLEAVLPEGEVRGRAVLLCHCEQVNVRHDKGFLRGS